MMKVYNKEAGVNQIHLGDVQRESLEAVAEAEYRPLIDLSTTIKTDPFRLWSSSEQVPSEYAGCPRFGVPFFQHIQ